MEDDTQVPPRMTRSESLWMGTTPLTEYPAFTESHDTEIAIIGGGIAGLAAAYRLTEAGKKVCVFEASRIATGTSGYTTAKVTSLHGTQYSFLEKHFDLNAAHVYGEANEWALGEITRIVESEKIECDFARLPAYTYAATVEEREQVENEAEVAQSAGLPAFFVPSHETGLPFETYGAVKFENQARFHPRKFLLSLTEKIAERGGQIFETTRIMKVEEMDDEVRLTTENGRTVRAKQVIVATNFPIYDKGMFFARMGQMRSYAIAAKIDGPLIEGMYLSAANEMEEKSLRPEKAPEGEWLVVGGGSHKVGEQSVNEKDQYAKIEEFAREKFPVESIEYRWSAQDSLTSDGVPFIGRMPRSERVYVTTGYGEWGMTTSFVSARLLTDLILGQDNPWAELFSPNRVKIGASVKEAFRGAKELIQGYGGYVTKHDDLASIGVDEGGIITQGSKKIAVSKDKEGKMIAVSAVCTHMGCLVHWNKGEKTWDCPCHGSRFSRHGKVLNGPAVKDLPPESLK